jgi:hypothetical protein
MLILRNDLEEFNAYLFGNYDSRGGSTLAVGYDNPEEALKGYLHMGFCINKKEDIGIDTEEEWQEYLNRELKNGDFMGDYKIIICDTPLPREDTELFKSYRDGSEDIRGSLIAQLRERGQNEAADQLQNELNESNKSNFEGYRCTLVHNIRGLSDEESNDVINNSEFIHDCTQYIILYQSENPVIKSSDYYVFGDGGYLGEDAYGMLLMRKENEVRP